VFLARAATTLRLPATTGASPNLLLGTSGGYLTRIVLKFGNLPDSAVVHSATLTLFAHSIDGQATAPFTATVHRLLKGWTESSVLWDSLSNAVDPTILASATISTAATDTVTFSIDTTFVNGWIAGTIPNQGLEIDFSGAEFVKEFHSFETGVSGKQPRLTLVFTRKGVRDTTDWAPAEDAFLVQSDPGVPAERLFIGNGIALRTLLKFDLSSISKDATINHARLEMPTDAAYSSLKSDGMVLGLYRLSSESWDPSSVTVDDRLPSPVEKLLPNQSSLSTIGSQSGASILRLIVQSWTSGSVQNYGLMVRSQEEWKDIARVAFFSPAADSASAPKLRVVYTLPSMGGF